MTEKLSDFTSYSFDEVCALLETPAPTLILFHRGPDADAVGSAFALRQILNDLGSEAYCICQDEIPDRLRFLAEPFQKTVLPQSIPEGFVPERVMTVDVASPNQLGTLYPVYKDHIDLMIDHHENGTAFANNYILPKAAAAGEILFDIVKVLAQQERVQITEQLCVDLYGAISSDTGCFRYSNVTPETHLRASELVASGINCADINHKLFETRSMDQLRATAAGISNIHLFADGKIAVIIFPYALKAALGLKDEHLEVLVDVARSLDGVDVAIAIRQPSADGEFRASCRSSCDFDVSALCSRFGGGGHAKAAGCTLKATDAEDAMNRIVEAIDVSLLD